MKKFLILLSLLLLVLTGCSADKGNEEALIQKTLPTVGVTKFSQFSVKPLSQKFISTVKPLKEIVVKSEQSGQISEKLKKIGDKINQNDLLATIGNSQNTSNLYTQYFAYLENYEFAEDRLNISNDLYSKNKGKLTSNLSYQLEILESKKNAINSSLELFANNVEINAINLEKAKEDLDNAVSIQNLELEKYQDNVQIAEDNLLFYQKNLDELKKSFVIEEENLESETLNLVNDIFEEITSIHGQVDILFGYSDSSSDDDFEKGFGVLNSNSKLLLKDKYRVFDLKYDELNLSFENYKKAKLSIDEIFVIYQDYLLEYNEYLSDIYVLASKYSTTIGEVNQSDIDRVINTTYSILNSGQNLNDQISKNKIKQQNFSSSKDLRLLEANNFITKAESALDSASSDLDVLDINNKNQISSFSKALDITNENLKNAKENLSKYETDADIEIMNLESQIKDLRSSVGILDTDVQLSLNSLSTEKNNISMNIDLLENELNALLVKSPIEGEILEEYVEQGDTINIGENLFKIASLDQMKLNIEVPVDLMETLYLDYEVEVECDLCKGEKIFIGYIDAISNNINKNTSKALIEISVDNKDHILKPNMLVKAKFAENMYKNNFVPLNLISIDGDKYELFVYENGKAILKNIEIGNVLEDMVEVVNGLNDDDLIITQGYKYLDEGDDIQIKKVRREI